MCLRSINPEKKLPRERIQIRCGRHAKTRDMIEPGFFCPRTHQPLKMTADKSFLESPAGDRYRIIDGIPEFLLDASQQQAANSDQEYYRTRAAEYDLGNDAMYGMLLCDEKTERSDIIGMLGLTPGSRVLEVGCGTCRDTIHLLDCGAFVYASDLSREMLSIGKNRLQGANAPFSRARLFVADAMRLPFPDGYFDAAFHFGGLNLFPDIAAGLAEMARVVKPDGRVVAGDEGVGPWLAGTDFAKILENSNPLFRHRAPLDKIPTRARDVTCRWVLNGSFYLIAFRVGSAEPQLDLDLEFPGRRGGSHRSRYYGKLEGVAPDLRDRVVDAAEKDGVSIVSWLEKALRGALSGDA
jgi:ubiquinone/menaquinone biosynthesis C-methylase UbiE